MLFELALWLGKDARFSTSSATSRCGPCWPRARRCFLAGLWAAGHPLAGRQEDRPGGARRRPKVAPHQGRHADHGGALILISIALTTLLWGDLRNKYVWVVLLVTLGFGAVGWVDDWRKVVTATRRAWRAAGSTSGPRPSPSARRVVPRPHRHAAGPARADRALLQGGELPAGRDRLHRPHLLRDQRHQPFGEPTDGLDGLAIMPTVMVSAALAIFAYVAGHMGFSKYLGCPTSPARASWR